MPTCTRVGPANSVPLWRPTLCTFAAVAMKDKSQTVDPCGIAGHSCNNSLGAGKMQIDLNATLGPNNLLWYRSSLEQEQPRFWAVLNMFRQRYYVLRPANPWNYNEHTFHYIHSLHICAEPNAISVTVYTRDDISACLFYIYRWPRGDDAQDGDFTIGATGVSVVIVFFEVTNVSPPPAPKMEASDEQL